MTTTTLKKPKIYEKVNRSSDLVGNDICQLCGHCCSWKRYGHIRYYYHDEINKMQCNNKRCYKYMMNQVKQLLCDIKFKPKYKYHYTIIEVISNLDCKWTCNNWDCVRSMSSADGNCKALVQKNGKYYCDIHSKFGYKNKSATCKRYKCMLFRDAKDYKDNYINLTEFVKRCGEFIRHNSLKKKITVEQLITALSE